MASQEKEVRPPHPRKALGNRGEDIAARFFIERGFEVVVRNWRCRIGEIDLIVSKGDEIRIVEVKTRRSLAAGEPEESVTESKLQRLDDLAQMYFSENGMEDSDYHIDVVSITFGSDGRPAVRHLEDVG